MTFLLVNTETWTLTVVGYLIVFIALVALITVFSLLPKLFKIQLKRKIQAEGKTPEEIDLDKDISGDETAAIAMALHLYFNDQHDHESNIITIKRIKRRYTPWSSKIYGVRNFPGSSSL